MDKDTQKGTLLLNYIAVHNAIFIFNADGMFHDRNMSGQPWKTTPREGRSISQIVMGLPKSSCKTIQRYRIVLKHLRKEFGLKSNRAAKATSDSSDDEIETGLCQTSSP